MPLPLFTPTVDSVTGTIVSSDPIDLTVDDCQLIKTESPDKDPAFAAAAAIHDTSPTVVVVWCGLDL